MDERFRAALGRRKCRRFGDREGRNLHLMFVLVDSRVLEVGVVFYDMSALNHLWINACNCSLEW